MTQLSGKAYNNYWSNTTSVYGAVWTSICSLISLLSFGNVDLGLFIFKIINVFIHLGNAYLLYKISRKKIFPIVYGLNPFILIESIANVHNDVYMVFFILLAIYELLKKKKIIPSLICLAVATDIKYIAILLLPIIVIYHYKDKDFKIRIIKCFECGLLFLCIAFIPYLLYFRDYKVFSGLYVQNTKISKGLYLFVAEYSNKPMDVIKTIKRITLNFFIISYCYFNIKLLMKSKIYFNIEIKKIYKFLIFFLFFIITNFQPWYFIWLTIVIIWQKAQDIKLITQMQLLLLITNTVFIIHSEAYRYGVPFFTILIIGTLLCIINNQNYRIKHLTIRNNNLYLKRQNIMKKEN